MFYIMCPYFNKPHTSVSLIRICTSCLWICARIWLNQELLRILIYTFVTYVTLLLYINILFGLCCLYVYVYIYIHIDHFLQGDGFHVIWYELHLCLSVHIWGKYFIKFLYCTGYLYSVQYLLVLLESNRGHGGRAVTLSPPTSEAGVRFPAEPQVGKLVVACRWSAVYSTEP